MNRIVPSALIAFAVAACTPPPKQPPPDNLKAQELAIVMAVGAQDISQLKVGQWALYSVRTAGSTASLSIRLAAVATDGSTFWMENRTITPSGPGGRPRTLISKYQIDASAKPIQLWVGEPPAGRPTKVPIEPDKPGVADSKAKVDIANEQITIAATGKSYDCTRLTSKVTYPDGRETTLVTWCSPEVPFSVMHNGKSYGGVVRKTYGTHTLELDAKGTDAVPELILPEK